MSKQLFLVNRRILNETIHKESLSDNSIAECLAPILDCRAKAVAVRIGSIRKGETIATDITFLHKLEKVLELKKDSLVGNATTKADLQRVKRVEERRRHEASLELSRLISTDGRKRSVEVDKDFLLELLELL